MMKLCTFLDVLIGCLKTNEAFKLQSFILSQQINGITSIYSNAFILLVYPKGSVSVQRCVFLNMARQTKPQPHFGFLKYLGPENLLNLDPEFGTSSPTCFSIFSPCSSCSLELTISAWLSPSSIPACLSIGCPG